MLLTNFRTFGEYLRFCHTRYTDTQDAVSIAPSVHDFVIEGSIVQRIGIALSDGVDIHLETYFSHTIPLFAHGEASTLYIERHTEGHMTL